MKCFILCLLLCGTLSPATLRADLNGDCRVDIADLAILMSEWLQEEDCNMSLGEELVVNGDFALEDTGWASDAGWTFDTETANWSGLSGGLNQDSLPVTAGKTYLVSYEVSDYAGLGYIHANLGGTSGALISFDGVREEQLIAGDDGTFSLEVTGSGCSLKADNVSVKEVLADAGGVLLSGDFFGQLLEE
ncbi:MAG: hypothetical protein IMZ61_03240 [Planctomycetes bacterium]|nr:hypothetical protein [Planctomycetota bacterium]